MTIEEMYALHQNLRAILEERFKARKTEIERRLEGLNRPTTENKAKRRRR